MSKKASNALMALVCLGIVLAVWFSTQFFPTVQAVEPISNPAGGDCRAAFAVDSTWDDSNIDPWCVTGDTKSPKAPFGKEPVPTITTIAVADIPTETPNTTVVVTPPATATPESPVVVVTPEPGNNGHGNNEDGCDSSNPSGKCPKKGADPSAPIDDEKNKGKGK